MDFNKDYIIYELESQVSGLLREEYLKQEGTAQSMFQIIYEPPFDEKQSLEVFKSLNEENIESYFVVKSVWDKAGDCSKLDDPLAVLKVKYKKILTVPTIKREKISIEKEIAEELYMQLVRIGVSSIADKESVALDGTSYELRITNSTNNKYSFKWWDEGPENLRELTTKVVEVLEYLSNIK